MGQFGSWCTLGRLFAQALPLRRAGCFGGCCYLSGSKPRALRLSCHTRCFGDPGNLDLGGHTRCFGNPGSLRLGGHTRHLGFACVRIACGSGQRLIHCLRATHRNSDVRAKAGLLTRGQNCPGDTTAITQERFSEDSHR